MTDVAAGPDPSGPEQCQPDPAGSPPAPRRARPVRWLAVALTLSVVLLLAAAVTGAVAPQVEVVGDEGPVTWDRTALVSFYVKNDAAADTAITAAGTSLPGLDLVGVAVAPVNAPVPDVIGPDSSGWPPAPVARPPDGGYRQDVPEPGDGLADGGVVVADRGWAEVLLRYEVTDCARARAAELRVPVDFRTPSRLTRTVDVTHDVVPSGDIGALLPMCT